MRERVSMLFTSTETVRTIRDGEPRMSNSFRQLLNSEREIETDKQTDRQRERERQTDRERETDRQTDRQTDRDRETDRGGGERRKTEAGKQL